MPLLNSKSGAVSHMCLQHAVTLIGICISIQQLEARSIHVDGTLVPWFSGVNVVIAVLEKIDASDVFEISATDWFQRDRDSIKSFLRRMAYVESKDGREKRRGGIWNILSEDELRSTQMYANTIDGQGQTLRQRIQNSSHLGFDWMAIGFNAERNNLSIPLYSGLATMIRLDQVLSSDVHEVSELSDQIRLWKTYFNGANNEDYRWFEAVTHLNNEMNEGCAIKTDVVFVIDASNSVSESDLTQAKEMIHHFTNMTMSNKLEHGYNRIGIVLIRSTAVVYHSLNESMNKTELLSKITDLPYQPYHFTNTADGLCKMKQQAWRRNQNVLNLAIVLSDGRSNYISGDPECEGNTEDVANLIHTENKHILVMAVGIGHRIDFDELSTIASGHHLVVELDGYNQTAGVPASLRYQICYTLSEPMDDNRTVIMKRDQIMRWIRKGVGGKGVTVRLCIRSGRVTLYVSSIPNPSDAVHDYQTTIMPEKNIAIACSTYFQHSRPIQGRNRRNPVSEDDTETVYISIIGQDNSSLVTLQTANGNVTFDTNECEQESYPCDESAICYNTDGSFYCECKEGFSGDGFECTGNRIIHTPHRNQLYIILPCCILGVVLVLLIVLLVSIITRRKCKRRKSLSTRLTQPQFHLSEIKLVKANLKKVNNNFSATNAIFEK